MSILFTEIIVFSGYYAELLANMVLVHLAQQDPNICWSRARRGRDNLGQVKYCHALLELATTEMGSFVMIVDLKSNSNGAIFD